MARALHRPADRADRQQRQDHAEGNDRRYPARRGPTLATEGNLNNDIGVPLTLLRLNGEHARAVIEMGANHPGEIAYLTGLARPDVAIINNAGPCHLEGFGDLAGVARAKGEIFQGLRPDGVAVINRDDDYADYWAGLNPGRRIVDFGLDRPAAVRGESSGFRHQPFSA